MSAPIRTELVLRKNANTKLVLRGGAVLAVSVPVAVGGGVLAMILPHEFGAVVASLMVIAMMILVIGGGGAMIRGALAANSVDRELRLLDAGPPLPAARVLRR